MSDEHRSALGVWLERGGVAAGAGAMGIMAAGSVPTPESWSTGGLFSAILLLAAGWLFQAYLPNLHAEKAEVEKLLLQARSESAQTKAMIRSCEEHRADQKRRIEHLESIVESLQQRLRDMGHGSGSHPAQEHG